MCRPARELHKFGAVPRFVCLTVGNFSTEFSTEERSFALNSKKGPTNGAFWFRTAVYYCFGVVPAAGREAPVRGVGAEGAVAAAGAGTPDFWL